MGIRDQRKIDKALKQFFTTWWLNATNVPIIMDEFHKCLEAHGINLTITPTPKRGIKKERSK
jgi:hypothetical protein